MCSESLKIKVWILAVFGAFIAFVGCGQDQSSDLESGESEERNQAQMTPEDEARKLAQEPGVGEVNEPPPKSDEFYHEGRDHSTTCKPIPDLESLEDPVGVVSIDGLSFHLWDREGSYDEVFPIGVGQFEGGDSKTPKSADDQQSGYFYYRGNTTAREDGREAENRRWFWNYSCRIWSGKKYDSSRTGQKQYRSYFAGLPFLRLEGSPWAAYGIHGPITNYWTEDGGTLRRGYVSEGCIRMKSEDIKEVFARLQGNKTPIKVQSEPEIRENGLVVNPDRFMNATCLTDSDCAGDRSICVDHPRGDGRFCTQPCQNDSQCPDREENSDISTPSRQSHCVPNSVPGIEASGICLTAAETKTNQMCDRFNDRFNLTERPLVNDPLTDVYVCAPSKLRWFGKDCESDSDCALNKCIETPDGSGFCSSQCHEFCPDRDGEPLSRCIRSIDGRASGGNCVPVCQSEADCEDGQECVVRSFSGRSGSDKVCVPDDERAKWFGARCETDSDCALSECIETADGTGYCSGECEEFCPDRDGEPLSRCVQSLDDEAGGSCVSTCWSESDCREGQDCVERSYSGRSGSDYVCVPELSQ